MKLTFKGKTVLVTGAGRGIGRDLCKFLHSECGLKVFALSQTQSNLDSLKKECPELTTLCVDLRNWEATRSAVKKLGPIDYLVNNAGVAVLKPFLELTEKDFDLSFDVNVKAMANLCQVVGADMVKRKQPGSIVNLSSQAAYAGLQDHVFYCASKGAVEMLTKTIALELGKHQIRVNCVNPTVVLTDMGKLGWSDPAKAGPMLAKIPLGKFAEIEDVIHSVAFLLSDQTPMTTGASFPVEGGYLSV